MHVLKQRLIVVLKNPAAAVSTSSAVTTCRIYNELDNATAPTFFDKLGWKANNEELADDTKKDEGVCDDKTTVVKAKITYFKFSIFL